MRAREKTSGFRLQTTDYGKISPKRSPRSPKSEVCSLELVRAVLDQAYLAFNHAEAATDPVQFVRRYESAADREIVGFCAASLAFGRVASVMQSVNRLLEQLGSSPATFVCRFNPATDGARIRPLVHRWVRGDDLVALLWVLRQMLEEGGTVERFFLEGLRPDAVDIREALESFSTRARAIDLGPARGKRSRPATVGHFFPRPSNGSGCKRLNLFLRWMVRDDANDVRSWTGVSPSQLIVPLDTHVIRLGRCLKLTRYCSPGWRMAAEITSSLRRFDPNDPVKYDFALCHLGMMNACGFNQPWKDTRCPLRGVCAPHAGLAHV